MFAAAGSERGAQPRRRRPRLAAAERAAFVPSR